jgi:hypothetical protein
VLVGSALLAIFFALEFVGRMLMTDYSGMTLNEIIQKLDWFPPCIFLPAWLVMTWFFARTFWSSWFPPRIKEGVRTLAKVVNFWQTGGQSNRDMQLGMLLEFNLQDGSPFEAEAKVMISWKDARNLRNDMTAEIVYDPARPRRFVVEALVV